MRRNLFLYRRLEWFTSAYRLPGRKWKEDQIRVMSWSPSRSVRAFISSSWSWVVAAERGALSLDRSVLVQQSTNWAL